MFAFTTIAEKLAQVQGPKDSRPTIRGDAAELIFVIVTEFYYVTQNWLYWLLWDRNEFCVNKQNWISYYTIDFCTFNITDYYGAPIGTVIVLL